MLKAASTSGTKRKGGPSPSPERKVDSSPKPSSSKDSKRQRFGNSSLEPSSSKDSERRLGNVGKRLLNSVLSETPLFFRDALEPEAAIKEAKKVFTFFKGEKNSIEERKIFVAASEFPFKYNLDGKELKSAKFNKKVHSLPRISYLRKISDILCDYLFNLYKINPVVTAILYSSNGKNNEIYVSTNFPDKMNNVHIFFVKMIRDLLSLDGYCYFLTEQENNLFKENGFSIRNVEKNIREIENDPKKESEKFLTLLSLDSFRDFINLNEGNNRIEDVFDLIMKGTIRKIEKDNRKKFSSEIRDNLLEEISLSFANFKEHIQKKGDLSSLIQSDKINDETKKDINYYFQLATTDYLKFCKKTDEYFKLKNIVKQMHSFERIKYKWEKINEDINELKYFKTDIMHRRIIRHRKSEVSDTMTDECVEKKFEKNDAEFSDYVKEETDSFRSNFSRLIGDVKILSYDVINSFSNDGIEIGGFKIFSAPIPDRKGGTFHAESNVQSFAIRRSNEIFEENTYEEVEFNFDLGVSKNNCLPCYVDSLSLLAKGKLENGIKIIVNTEPYTSGVVFNDTYFHTMDEALKNPRSSNASILPNFTSNQIKRGKNPSPDRK